MAAILESGTDDIFYHDCENECLVFIDEIIEEPATKFQYYSEAVDGWLPFNACEIVAELEEGNEIKYRVN